MSHETYDEHLRENGSTVSLADASRFDWHRRTCSVCSVSKYAYTRCREGQRLAKLISGVDKLRFPR
jgi:hypothetical protein